MKRSILALIVILGLSIAILAASDLANAAIINIPDPNFKSYLIDNFDTDGDGEISQTEAAVSSGIKTPGQYATTTGKIKDLSGIEAFVNITSLNCGFEELTSLPNLSSLTKLQRLTCNFNQLASLPNLSALTKLQTLYCGNNQLTNLPDLSALTNLTQLHCIENQLTTLPDLSSLTNLTMLSVGDNQLTSLPDLSTLTKLDSLLCGDNYLTDVPDLSLNLSLEGLWIKDNYLDEGDCPDLLELSNRGVSLYYNRQNSGDLYCSDACPDDPLKIKPGICGCGVADIDTDNDSYPDCNDGCPSDPLKTVTGVCGCGIADTDTDTDGTPDCNDIDDDDDGLIDSADIGPLDPLSPCLDMDYFAVMPILSSFSSSDTDRVVFFDISDSICFEMISCVKQARLCDSTIIYGGSGDIVGGNGSDIIVYRYDYEGNYSVSISLTEQDNRESYTDYFEITAEIVETPLPLLDFSILVENSTVTITPVDIDSSDADIISLVVFWGDRYRDEYTYPLQEDISHQYNRTGTDYHIRVKMLNTDEEVFNYTYMNDEDLMVSIP